MLSEFKLKLKNETECPHLYFNYVLLQKKYTPVIPLLLLLLLLIPLLLDLLL